jgi:hypothetical protein|tara:strand:+ start:542 stop:724 length:183 start_codon:yes stop_codon:yes gene_type:complete
MRALCIGMAFFCAIVGVGVLEDCAGDCIPEDANALWRWIVAIVAVMGTAFFGFAGAVIKR